MRKPLTICLLLLIYLDALAAPGGEPYRPFRDAAPKVVPKLTALADWCQEHRMFRERAHVLEAVLAFDPDHKPARRALKYVRKDGGWVRRARYRPPKTTQAEHLPEFLRRRAGVLDPLIETVLTDLDLRRDEILVVDRSRALENLVRVDPENAEVRVARGEQRLDGRWVLKETVTARTRAAELKEAAQKALGRQPKPMPAPIDDPARFTGIAWAGAMRSDVVVVIGTVSRSEFELSVTLSGATGDLFREALGIEIRHAVGFVIYLLQTASQRDMLLENHPGMTPDRRDLYRQLASAWMPKSQRVGIWQEDPNLRREWVARQTIASFLRRGFNISTKKGAYFEGIGLYLSHLLVGQRQTWFVRRSEYAGPKSNLDDKLAGEGADWLGLSLDLWKKGEGPDYRVLLGLNVNAMDTRDLVHSYAFGAYLLEGRPEGLLSFLRSVGAGEHPADAVPAHLGFSVEDLQRRVRRWLEERGS